MGTPATPAVPHAPRHWYCDDPLRTRLLESMSLLAPEAERFFIASVRDHLDQADAELRERCKTFIREEGQHSREHARFNQRFSAQGVEVDEILRPARAIARAAGRWLSPAMRLAVTAAGEHLSALLSQLFLDHAHAADFADDEVRRLYERHAREELGHRDVAFDLMTRARLGYARRILALLAVSLVTPLLVVQVTHRLLAGDSTRRWSLWLRGLPWLLGAGGGFLVPRQMVARYLRYFQPRFHPARAGIGS